MATYHKRSGRVGTTAKVACAPARDFLVVGKISDAEDVKAFIDSLANHGFDVSTQENREFIHHTLKEMDLLKSIESDSVQKSASSWREIPIIQNQISD